jgi:hypothetical protein
MAYGSVNVDAMTTSDGVTSAGTYGFKNRIINGNMVIDQRNAGASVTQGTGNTFPVDRFFITGSVVSKFTAQQSSTAPSGFNKSLLITSSSAYSVGSGDFFVLAQNIEGYNVADLNWGTANAKTITLSFQVYSSLTGTFGGALVGGATYSYPFTYTISSANTWTTISVTIAGPTSGGTWDTTNGSGLIVRFGLGVGTTYSGTAGSWTANNYFSATGATSVVGTNGATFYITGVQLEKGSTATSFDYRPYGTELALCQRYYYRNTAPSGSQYGSGYNDSTANAYFNIPFPVTMRTSPTALEQSGTAGNYAIQRSGDFPSCTSVPVFDSANTQSAFVRFTSTGNLTAGQGSSARSANSAGYLGWSAEL